VSNSYIVLTDSVGNAYRFTVTLKGYRPSMIKSDKISQTITGKLVNQIGVVTRTWMYRLKAPATATPPNGTLADLKALFTLDDPNGTPNNIITLTDIDGSSHSVYLVGELTPQLQSYDLSTSPSYVVLKMMETTAI